MFAHRVLIALAAASWLAAACNAAAPSDDDDVDAGDEPDPLQDDCSPLFDQDILPEYRVTISDAEWAALNDEFLNRAEREEAGLDPTPYHPIEFHYDGIDVPGAMIRLKGQSSWWETIAFDERPKMQFVISFNEVDPGRRFLGVRKVELDMPRTDASFLRQRLGLYYLRWLGLEAQCANSARLVINGELYGLYTNLERLDKEFIQRVFGKEHDEGDLWKGGRIIKNNEETFTWDRLDAFWHPTGLEEIETLVDVDAAVREWAAEAMIPHGDGYYNGRANYYLYDHPVRGFVWLPHDLDAAYDYLPADTSPLFPECDGRNPNDREHWALVLGDQQWLDRYVDYLAEARANYDAAMLAARVDEWSAQIAASAEDDPHRPFAIEIHHQAVDQLRGYMARRAGAVDDWLDCRWNGGADGDGDGFESCYDCNDASAQAHPGAIELCNGIDDNCDGQIDEPDGGSWCE